MMNLNEAVNDKLETWSNEDLAKGYTLMGDINLHISEEGITSIVKEVDSNASFTSKEINKPT